MANEHGQKVQQVKAGFIDVHDVVSVEATFMLPTKMPQDRAGSYQIDSDPQNLVYRVTSRVQSKQVLAQAGFGYQILTTFQRQTPEESDEDGSLVKGSTIFQDENTSTTESTISADMSILDSYIRAISSARSSVDYFPLAIRQESSVWLNALDIDEPMGTSRHRSSLEWLDLASIDDIIRSTRVLLDLAESLIDEPKDTMVLEPSSTDHKHIADKHPHVQEQTSSQNQSSWGDSIDLDAAFGGSATDLAEDFSDPNALQYPDSPLNKSQWGDIEDLDGASGGIATDLEYQANKKSQQDDDSSSKKWEDVIDLDAAFGGSATDLEEEEEEEEEEEFEEEVNNSQQATAAVYVAATAPPMNEEEREEKEEEKDFFKSPNLRRHIPDDIEERVKYICQSRFTDDDGQVVAGGMALAKACAEWEYMSEAARENKRLGLFKRQGKKIPEEVEGVVKRSCATSSWEKEEWLTTGSNNKPSSVRPFAATPATPTPTVDQDERPGPVPEPEPCHHINFLGDPCAARSNTSPEDSFWVVVTSNYRFHHETFSRQGVIIAQANKLVDPFEYDPTAAASDCDLSQLAGSKLRDAVVGKVRKVYLDCGTWVDDDDYNYCASTTTKDQQHVPVPLSYESMMSRNIYWKGTYLQYNLQQPHRINNRLDLDDLVVNKGEIIPPKRHYRDPNDLFLPCRSKLCNMELVEDEDEDEEQQPEEARPMIPYIRAMGSLFSTPESNNGELQKKGQLAAADRAPEFPQGHKKGLSDGQMETRLDIDLAEEGGCFTSSQRDDKQSSKSSEVEKANEDLVQILNSVGAPPSACPSPLEPEEEEEEEEDSSSSLLCNSRGKFSSVVSTSSSEVELTALDEVVKVDGEIDFVLDELSQLMQVDQKEEDVRDFVNSLPSPICIDDDDDDDDVLGEDGHNEEERLDVEEIVRAPEKTYKNLPQDRLDKEEEGLLLLVNEKIPSLPENGYPDLTTTPQDSPQQSKEKVAVVVKKNPSSQPTTEDVSLERIRALEAVLMREFDFSKKSKCPLLLLAPQFNFFCFFLAR